MRGIYKMIIVLRDNNIEIIKNFLSDFTGRVKEKDKTLTVNNRVYMSGSAMRVTFNEDNSISITPEKIKKEKYYEE